ncbi:long-chain-acyl-CoA synthetase [Aliiglaciecola lipolytica]|uniref:Solute carrier family 27 (Fatty acid transporter), member 1/4 n=1 Tax=Aliiglaciecola lipolytica E3 TaxID=1127673 RepID=K6YRM1_9ALTE|nr:long-chain-acyl-CoA synthetase [Aliiglaciecola lipolytica]GAC13970.1 solute carrier family 27 (fatty acid transporter), member 1/4 [Aliiglaciecola lipolytica E3]
MEDTTIPYAGSLDDAPVLRADTQAKMDKRAMAARSVSPSQKYSIADRLEAQAKDYADSPFIVYQGKTYTYKDVNEQANRLANAVQARGLKEGDVCAMALENRPEFFFTWFGLTKLGVIVAFINTQVQGSVLEHAIKTTNSSVVIVGEECVERFIDTPALASKQIWLLPDAEISNKPSVPSWIDTSFSNDVSLQNAQSTFDRNETVGETPTLLIFTSGTTGLPKAAIYSHMRWLTSGDVMVDTTSATPDDVFYCCLPLYHGAAATSVTSTALAAGASIVVRRKFSVSQFWRDIQQYGVTTCQYIGEICRYLLNYADANGNKPKNHSLRCMLGAGLTDVSWRRWLEYFGQMDIYEGWGSTEANTNLINIDNFIGSCGRVPRWDRTNFRLVRFDTETETHFKDENGNYILCQPGEVGEGLGMIINHPDFGGGRFEGYTSKEGTEKKILRDVFQKGDAYWRSGDLLRYDENGYFYFVDRIGDTYRWKSENVSTQEVATALSEYEGAELVNIYGVQVPENEGRAGMAAIVMQDGYQFDPQSFYELTVKTIPNYAAPQFVRVSKAADMTSTFKLRKVDLQKQGYDPTLCNEPIYVRNDKQGAYQEYSKDALQAAGFAPFVIAEEK